MWTGPLYVFLPFQTTQLSIFKSSKAELGVAWCVSLLPIYLCMRDRGEESDGGQSEKEGMRDEEKDWAENEARGSKSKGQRDSVERKWEIIMEKRGSRERSGFFFPACLVQINSRSWQHTLGASGTAKCVNVCVRDRAWTRLNYSETSWS